MKADHANTNWKLARGASFDGILLDITEPNFQVEVRQSEDGKVLWVDVGPVTVLRICQIPTGDEVTSHGERR